MKNISIQNVSCSPSRRAFAGSAPIPAPAAAPGIFARVPRIDIIRVHFGRYEGPSPVQLRRIRCLLLGSLRLFFQIFVLIVDAR